MTASYHYIDRSAGLDELTARMRGSARVALDTEADSLHNYFEKVCLIQVGFQGAHYVVDPLAGLDLAPFLETLRAKALVLHGGDYDLRMLRATFGFRPGGAVFDTMIAAQLLGFSEIGLAALVAHYFGVTLSKKGQKSDWSKRPLTEELLRYASDDTRYLEGVAERMEGELRSKGRWAWKEESSRRMVEASAHDRMADPDAEWRVKGAGVLRPKELAYLRELWGWRENEAQAADIPAFKILGNRELLALALWAAGPPAVSRPKLPRHCNGKRLRELEAAIERARAMPSAEWPRWPERKPFQGPHCRREADALIAECSRLAEGLGLLPSVVAPRAALEAVARTRCVSVKDIMSAGSLMRWQAEMLTPSVKKVFGEQEV